MAETYAQDTLKRVQGILPSEQEQFARVTLALCLGDIHHALEETKKLQGKDSSPFLTRFNLLRLALLEKETGNVEGELIAWHEFEKHAALPEINAFFGRQGVGFSDFVAHRRQVISATK